MKFQESIRPFTPSLKKFALAMVLLQAIFAALMVNPALALSIVVAAAASLIKVYKIDPEPILLVLMHAAITVSMLWDPLTAFAIIATVVFLAVTFGDLDLPRERIAVFLVSVTVSTLFGKVAATLGSVVVAAGIILLKFRPLEPPSLSLLALGSLGLSVMVNRVLASMVLFVIIGTLTGLFIVNRMSRHKDLNEKLISHRDRISTVSNGYLPMSSPLESLDLHGHTVTGAMKVLHSFLREHEEAYRKNRARHVRHVTIITGDCNQTNNSHDPTNLIKPTVVNYLKINKYKYESPSESPALVKVDLESHAL